MSYHRKQCTASVGNLNILSSLKQCRLYGCATSISDGIFTFRGEVSDDTTENVFWELGLIVEFLRKSSFIILNPTPLLHRVEKVL